jgi:hypothetical protein
MVFSTKTGLLSFILVLTSTFSLRAQNYQKAELQSSSQEVVNSSHAIDGNSTGNLATFSTLPASTGIALGAGAYDSEQTLSYSNTLPANTSTYLRIDTSTGILKSLLGGLLGDALSSIVGGVLIGNQILTIEILDSNGQIIETSTIDDPDFSNNTLNNLKIVSNENGETFLWIKPNQSYKSIRIKNDINSLVGLGNTVETYVYGMFYNSGTCEKMKFTSFSASGGILSANLTGSPVKDPENVINTNPSDFSLLEFPTLSVAGSVEQSIHYLESKPSNTNYYLSLKPKTQNLLQLELLDNIYIDFLLNGTQVHSKSLNEIDALIDLDLLTLLQNDSILNIKYSPGVAADEVRIRLTNLVNLNLQGSIEFYHCHTFPNLPTTKSATNISSTEATLQGELNDLDQCNYKLYGFEYSTNANFEPGTGTFIQSSNLNNDLFSKELSGLEPETTYYFRAVASNDESGVNLFEYGSELSFQTGIITWLNDNGTTKWDNTTGPNTSYNALIDADYDSQTEGSITAKNLTINSGKTLTISKNEPLVLSGEIINNGVLNASLGKISLEGSDNQNFDANVLTNEEVAILKIDKAIGTEVSIQNELDVTEKLELVSGDLKLSSNSLIIFKSNGSKAGYLDVVDCNLSAINYEGTGDSKGAFMVEINIPNNQGNGQVSRSYRFLTSSVDTDTSINSNWQEGETISSYADIQNSNANGYGTHITGWGKTGGANASSGLDYNSTGASSMYTFDNINQSWNAVVNTVSNNLMAGKPYYILVRGDRSTDLSNNSSQGGSTILRAKGELKLCNQDVSNQLAQQPDEFSLIGNVYQAPIDASLLLNDASDLNSNFYWYLDPYLGDMRGTYVVVDLSDGSTNYAPGSGSGTPSGNEYIQAGQGFLVQNSSSFNNGGPQLIFKETHKSLNSGENLTVFNQINSNDKEIQISLQTTQGLNLDATKIKFNSNYSNNLVKEDALRAGINTGENLSVNNNGELVMIDKRKLPSSSDSILLDLRNLTRNQYILNFNIDFFNQVTPILIDNYTRSQIDLSQQQNYVFQANSSIPLSVAENRFKIIFNPVQLNSETKEISPIRLYPNPAKNVIYLETEIKNITTYAIYNSLGAQILNGKIKEKKIEIDKLAMGSYILEINSTNQSFKFKIIKK